MELKYLSDLEFDKILDIISSNCLTKEGREKVLSIRPVTYTKNYSEAVSIISYRHSLISKMKKVYNRITIPYIDYSIVNIWKTYSKGGSVLNPKDIYSVYEFMLSFRDLLIFITSLDDEFLVLKEVVKIDTDYFYDKFEDIRNSVFRCIDKDGGILRTASEKLDRIITEKERIELTVMKILNDFINQPENEEFLQDKFVTIRNNRFVIPLKMEYVNAIDGFVQDISSTGHTAFVEPKFVQSYSIRYLELVDEEKKEVERILRDLTSKIGSLAWMVDDIIDLISEFDALRALGEYSVLMNCEKPTISSKPKIKLIKARHPLLKNAVPIDVEIGDGDSEFGGLIISGPNTSGKTVSIKTVGLLTAMALSGLLIPAESTSVIGYFSKILVDIGDPQSIERNLSTFSAHIIRLNEIIKVSDFNSLVIIDEIGTGTDPREGEALAVAILKRLAFKKAKIVVATHYSLVKKLPLSLEYFKNSYMEFDEQSLRPLYRLVMGMPGSSNAILIAHKLGLDNDIIQDALKVMVEGVDIYDKFVIEVQKERREVQKLKDELNEKIQEIERIKKDYRMKLSELEDKLGKIRRKEIDVLIADIHELKMKVSKIRERLIGEKVTQKELEEINKEISEISYKMFDEIFEFNGGNRVKNPKLGDKVFSNRFKQVGVISRMYSDGKVEILAGKLKLITTIEDLFEVQ